MMPQFRQFLLCGALAGIAFISAVPALAQQAGQTPPPPPVTVMDVKAGTQPLSYQYAARITAFRQVEVRARVGGILLKRNFVEGAEVKAGDTLFTLDPATYQAALNQSKAQEAILDEARSHEDPLGLVEEKTLSILRMLAEDEHQQRIYAILIFSCESADDDSEAAQRIVAANAGMYEKLRKIIMLADELKMLSPGWTVDTAARAFQCSINGLFGEWLRSDKAFPLVDVGERLVVSLIGSMRRAQNAGRTASAA